MIPELIEREIVIAAPVERVWAALTEPAHIGAWFADSGAEVDLCPGGSLVLHWRDYGRILARVEGVDPPRAFSFRWARPGDLEPRDDNSTLVEFTLHPEAGGTRLRVVESGFRDLGLPEKQAAAYADENTQGWTDELDELRAYLDLAA